MKKCLFIFFAIIYISHTTNCQEISVGGNFSSSSNNRFNNGFGYDIHYYHQLLKRIMLGFGYNYIRYDCSFDEAAFTGPIFDGVRRIESSSQRKIWQFSAQYLIKNDNYLLIAIGSEINFNIFNCSEKITAFSVWDTIVYHCTHQEPERKDYGWGISSQILVKKFPFKRTSVYINIKKEFVPSNERIYGINYPLLCNLSFLDFKIGINYRIKK